MRVRNQIMRFLLANFAECRKWGRARLRAFVQFYIDHDLYCFYGIGKRPVAFACARPVEKAEDGLISYKLGPRGSFCFVDLVVCKDPRAVPFLFQSLAEKVGVKEKLVFRRGKYAGRLRTYALTSLSKKMTHLSYGRRPT